jgi:hypothetical protein
MLDPRTRFEIEGASPALSGGIAFVGALAGLLLFHALASDAYRARLIVAGAAVIGIGYAAMTLSTTALQRSKLVDQFPVCESGEPPAEPLSRPLLSPVEGPRLDSGAPCTQAAERRADHIEEYPQGSFQDGVIQIARRFSGDRPRAFGGTGFALLALLFSGIMVFRAAVETPGGAARWKEDDDPQVPE